MKCTRSGLQCLIPHGLLFLTILAITLSALPPRAAAEDTPGKALERAEKTYFRGRFDEAIEILESLLPRHDLIDEQRISGLLLHSFCRNGRGELLKTEQIIGQILEIDREFQPDPDRVPPGWMVRYFNVLEARGLMGFDPGLKTIAVLDLMNCCVTEYEAMQPLARGLAAILISALHGGVDLRVVERERVDWILKEIELQRSELVDDSTKVRVGRLLGVQTVLLGNYVRINERMRVDARLVSVETGEVLSTCAVDGKFDTIFKLTEDLAGCSAKSVNREIQQRLAAPKKDPFGALMKYSEGLAYLDDMNLTEAARCFEETLEMAPDFTKAQYRLETLSPLLAWRESSEDR